MSNRVAIQNDDTEHGDGKDPLIQGGESDADANLETEVISESIA